MKKRFVFFSLLVSAFYLVNPFFVHGQQTIKPSDPYEHFRQAKFFFDSNNFTAAQEEFRFYLKLGLAVIPALLFGALLKKYIDAGFSFGTRFSLNKITSYGSKTRIGF